MYLIRVQGELDESWLDFADDISIVVSAPTDQPCISTLCAHNADQATVLGILNSLNQFGYPLLYLELLK